MKTFKDVDNDILDVEEYDGRVHLCVHHVESDKYLGLNIDPSDARAVAAEIIACADRIEGKEAAGPPRAELVPVVTHVTNIAPESTPTHTSHASLVVFAKAIAYLPTPMRDELNALLASKLRVALS